MSDIFNEEKGQVQKSIETKGTSRMGFYGQYSSNIPNLFLTSETNFSNYLLIVDAYSNPPKLYVMERVTTKEVMDKLDMFQDRF